MPSSPPVHISYCLDQIINLSPASILDLGCGMGRWGLLCREFCDGLAGHYHPDQWTVQIDGIEVFEPYVWDLHRLIYNHVYVEDLRTVIPRLGNYDLIIAGDVIEHFEKDEAMDLLRQLLAKTNLGLLVNIPLGDHWEQGAIYGNVHETHRSVWTLDDFAGFDFVLHRSQVGSEMDYATLVFPTGCSEGQRAFMLLCDARDRQREGDAEGAATSLETLLAIAPAQQDAAMMLAALLVEQSRFGEAAQVMQRAADADPAFHYAHLLAARFFLMTGDRTKARHYVEPLLEQEDVAQEMREQAGELLGQILGPPRKA